MSYRSPLFSDDVKVTPQHLVSYPRNLHAPSRAKRHPGSPRAVRCRRPNGSCAPCRWPRHSRNPATSAAEVTTPTCFLPAISGQPGRRAAGRAPSISMARICFTGPSLATRSSASRPIQPMAVWVLQNRPSPHSCGVFSSRHVVAVAQQARPRSARSRWGSPAHVQVDARLHQRVPKRHADICALDIDLEPALLRIARARDHHVAALEIEMPEAEEADVAHAFAEDRAIRSSARGPCTASGETSGSSTSTSRR
jgi:hypothetical protein